MVETWGVRGGEAKAPVSPPLDPAAAGAEPWVAGCCSDVGTGAGAGARGGVGVRGGAGAGAGCAWVAGGSLRFGVPVDTLTRTNTRKASVMVCALTLKKTEPQVGDRYCGGRGRVAGWCSRRQGEGCASARRRNAPRHARRALRCGGWTPALPWPELQAIGRAARRAT